VEKSGVKVAAGTFIKILAWKGEGGYTFCMQEQFKALLHGRETESAVIPVEAITFAPELMDACRQNVCGNYGKSWSCPPALHAEREQELIRSCKYAFVFTSKWQLEDSFDFEGMREGQIFHRKLAEELHAAFPDNPIYSAGGCTCCEKCAYPAPCRFPRKAFPSMEALGVYVTALSEAAGVKYNNGPDTVTYFSMILF
jgi:predicted metal-binding protein